MPFKKYILCLWLVFLLVDASNLYSQVGNQTEKLLNEIKSLSKQEVIVSEHAVLRYLERVKGIDLNSIKKEILSDYTLKFIEKLKGNGVFPNEKGFSLKVKDNVVITIIAKENQV